MSQVIARFPVLADGRFLGFVAAAVLALVSLVASGDPAAAGWSTSPGRFGCGGCR